MTCQRPTCTASVHDSRHFEVVLDDWNTSAEVYADRGYPSQEREEQLKAQGCRSRIQRKGSRNHPLSECQQRADFALTMMAVTYNIKRLVFLEAGPIRAVACP
jgi:IS5 family transposase